MEGNWSYQPARAATAGWEKNLGATCPCCRSELPCFLKREALQVYRSPLITIQWHDGVKKLFVFVEQTYMRSNLCIHTKPNKVCTHRWWRGLKRKRRVPVINISTVLNRFLVCQIRRGWPDCSAFTKKEKHHMRTPVSDDLKFLLLQLHAEENLPPKFEHHSFWFRWPKFLVHITKVFGSTTKVYGSGITEVYGSGNQSFWPQKLNLNTRNSMAKNFHYLNWKI